MPNSTLEALRDDITRRINDALNDETRKQEVIESYCTLSSQVAEGVFHNAHAADCFCGHTVHDRLWNYAYENAVLDYIRKAVHERMTREGHSIPTRR